MQRISCPHPTHTHSPPAAAMTYWCTSCIIDVENVLMLLLAAGKVADRQGKSVSGLRLLLLLLLVTVQFYWILFISPFSQHERELSWARMWKGCATGWNTTQWLLESMRTAQHMALPVRKPFKVYYVGWKYVTCAKVLGINTLWERHIKQCEFMAKYNLKLSKYYCKSWPALRVFSARIY